MATLDRNSKAVMRTWINMLQQVRDELGDIPVQMLATLLECASEEGLTVQDIETRLRMTKASASRNVLALTTINARKEPGPGIVVTREDPVDRRFKRVELTPKGRRLIDTLLHPVGKKVNHA